MLGCHLLQLGNPASQLSVLGGNVFTGPVESLHAINPDQSYLFCGPGNPRQGHLKASVSLETPFYSHFKNGET
jgi:hypothetical protein